MTCRHCLAAVSELVTGHTDSMAAHRGESGDDKDVGVVVVVVVGWGEGI